MSKKNRDKRKQAFDFRGIPRVEPPVVEQTYLGTQKANGEPSASIDERRHRCFELATYAVVFGTAPPGSRLVHGTWHGPGATQRIPHAWVELPGGFVWEPITARVYECTSFAHWTDCWAERTYDARSARWLVDRHQTYGPWHASRYHQEDQPTEEKEETTDAQT